MEGPAAPCVDFLLLVCVYVLLWWKWKKEKCVFQVFQVQVVGQWSRGSNTDIYIKETISEDWICAVRDRSTSQAVRHLRSQQQKHDINTLDRLIVCAHMQLVHVCLMVSPASEWLCMCVCTRVDSVKLTACVFSNMDIFGQQQLYVSSLEPPCVISHCMSATQTLHTLVIYRCEFTEVNNSVGTFITKLLFST